MRASSLSNLRISIFFSVALLAHSSMAQTSHTGESDAFAKPAACPLGLAKKINGDDKNLVEGMNVDSQCYGISLPYEPNGLLEDSLAALEKRLGKSDSPVSLKSKIQTELNFTKNKYRLNKKGTGRYAPDSATYLAVSALERVMEQIAKGASVSDSFANAKGEVKAQNMKKLEVMENAYAKSPLLLIPGSDGERVSRCFNEEFCKGAQCGNRSLNTRDLAATVQEYNTSARRLAGQNRAFMETHASIDRLLGNTPFSQPGDDALYGNNSFPSSKGWVESLKASCAKPALDPNGKTPEFNGVIEKTRKMNQAFWKAKDGMAALSTKYTLSGGGKNPVLRVSDEKFWSTEDLEQKKTLEFASNFALAQAPWLGAPEFESLHKPLYNFSGKNKRADGETGPSDEAFGASFQKFLTTRQRKLREDSQKLRGAMDCFNGSSPDCIQKARGTLEEMTSPPPDPNSEENFEATIAKLDKIYNREFDDKGNIVNAKSEAQLTEAEKSEAAQIQKNFLDASMARTSVTRAECRQKLTGVFVKVDERRAAWTKGIALGTVTALVVVGSFGIAAPFAAVAAGTASTVSAGSWALLAGVVLTDVGFAVSGSVDAINICSQGPKEEFSSSHKTADKLSDAPSCHDNSAARVQMSSSFSDCYLAALFAGVAIVGGSAGGTKLFKPLVTPATRLAKLGVKGAESKAIITNIAQLGEKFKGAKLELKTAIQEAAWRTIEALPKGLIKDAAKLDEIVEAIGHYQDLFPGRTFLGTAKMPAAEAAKAIADFAQEGNAAGLQGLNSILKTAKTSLGEGTHTVAQAREAIKTALRNAKHGDGTPFNEAEQAQMLICALGVSGIKN